MEAKIFDCVIIGAGPAGIVATKELLEHGLRNVICLEQSDKLGGTFSKSYDSLVLTSSVTFSMFSDFWVGDGKSHNFWTKDEAVQYWGDYTRHYGCMDHIKLGRTVTEVSQADSTLWEIKVANGEHFRSKKLILAIGNNRVPKFPDWAGELSDVSVSHSRDYINAQPFKGKRVLIVGGGESASDVAYEVSQVAEKCWISLRESTGWIVPRARGGHAADVSTHRGIWDLPRDFGAKLSPFVLKLERARQDPVFDALADLNDRVKAKWGIWGIYGTKTLALPKAVAHHGCLVVEDICEVSDGGRSMMTTDDQFLDNVDAVIFCTGYLNRAGFMPQHLQDCDPRKMYKNMFLPESGDNIAWIGWARPGFGSQFPIMEMQARYCAMLFAGKKHLPDPDKMRVIAHEDFEIYKEQFESNAEKIRSLVDYHRYMDSMAAIIGCTPPLYWYFFRHPGLWIHLMYGPTQATQFRLRGPGKKVKLAQEIIGKLPISTFNHIVKAGLRARFSNALQALTPRVMTRS